MKKIGRRPSTFRYFCAWLSREKKFFENFSFKRKYFRDKSAWLSEGDFTLDPELFKISVLGYIEELKNFYLRPCTF